MLPASVLVGSAKVEKKLPIPSADMVNKDPTTSALLWTPPVSGFYFDWLPESPFIYHWQEEYNYQYQSNVDSPQVLRHSLLITDSKLYQYQVSQYWARFVVSGFDTEGDVDTSYDEDVFLIHSTAELTAFSTTVRRPVAYAEPFFTIINRDINNLNTMLVNLGNLPASASLLYNQLNSIAFKAYYTPSGTEPTIVRNSPNGQKTLSLVQGVQITNTSPLQFLTVGEFVGNTTYYGASGTALLLGNLEPAVSPPPPSAGAITRTVAGFNDITPRGFVNSGTYNTTIFSWEAPFAGSYSFRLYLEVYTNTYFGATLAQWDSAGNLKRGIRIGNISYLNRLWLAQHTSGWTTVDHSTGLLGAQAGDVFQIVVDTVTANIADTSLPIGLAYLSEDSFWSIDSVSIPSAGGTVISTEKGATFLFENELEADVPLNIWNQIKANPFAKFRYQVADDGEARTAFLKDFDREIISGRFNGVTKLRTKTPDEANAVIQTDPQGEPEEPEPDEEE
jgi:hypothetical protein